MAAVPGIAAHRATLLVGYGRFGLDLLQHFLFTTATRGVLAFDEPAGAESSRRLRDLALLWVRDPFEMGGAGTDSVPKGSETELVRDLNDQIQRLEDTEAEAPFRELLAENARVLLDAARRAAHRENLPPGLDVIVVAHPDGREDLGRLAQLLAAGFDELKRFATPLEPAVATAGALNFIQILDFENYWHDSEPGREMRRSVYQAVEMWRQRGTEGKAGFGRIYLVDGFTGEGTRSERTRIDEIALFLEFLLFEGRRADLQWLYQLRTPGESPLAAFGIRLHERSAGLLSRLAAARFGMGWLDFLAGDHLPAGSDPEEFLQALAPFRIEALERTVALGIPPDESAATGFLGLAAELERLDVDDPEWPWRVRAAYELAAGALERQSARRIRLGMQGLLRQPPWADLPARLREAVAAALHHDRRPLPLGWVIRELESVLDEFRRKPGFGSSPVDGSPDPWAELTDSHEAYRRFLAQQLETRGFRRFLVWFSVLLGLAVAPVMAELLEDIQRPDPAAAHFLVRHADRFGHWLATHPVILASGLAGLAWGAAVTLVGPGMDHRQREARIFWNESERGRLTHRLRSLLAPDGELGARFRTSAEEELQRLAAGLGAEVVRELSRVLELLRRRQREMRWLRRQLQEFLNLYGLNPLRVREDWSRMNQETTGIRHALEQYRDFERMLRGHPPEAERFPAAQAERRPFRNWDQPYSEAFLFPLRFIDDLSRQYRDPFEQTLAQPGTGAEEQARVQELLRFFRDFGRFPPAFAWRAQHGVPQVRFYGLVPQVLGSMAAVRQELRDLGMAEGDILSGRDAARAYLLRIQLGIDPACLST